MGSSPNTNENGKENIFNSADAATHSDDSADIDYIYEGYHRIPTDQIEEIDTENNCGIEFIENTNATQLNQQRVGTSLTEVDFESKVWGNPRPKELEIELDTSKTEQIMAAMASITLPLSAIPKWAHEISENKWKENLLSRIKQQKERCNYPSSNFQNEDLKN